MKEKIMAQKGEKGEKGEKDRIGATDLAGFLDKKRVADFFEK